MATKTLKASIIIGGALSGSLRSALTSTQSGLKRIGQEIVNIERRQRELQSDIGVYTAMGRNADALRAKYAALGREADQLRAAHNRLDAVQKRVEANARQRRELGGQFRNALGGTIAAAFPIGVVANYAARFERENQLIGNTANMTAAQVRELGATISRTARITNQTAPEVQRAIGFLVAAGLDIGTAQASIKAIGRTTTATGADIEDLSKAAFTLIDSLKIAPDGLQGALDILAVAGKEGNVELRDMAKTLPSLGSSFVALKMQGSEAAATLGAALEVARKGAGDADEAANNMRNFMAKVLSPETKKRAEKAFGLDLSAIIRDAQAKGGNPFEAAMAGLIRVTQGDQEKIGQIFQDMQVQNFLRPMIQNWAEYKRIKDVALSKSSGTTDRDFARMMATTAERMKSVRIAAGRLGIALGTALAPSIGNAAEKLTGLLDTATGIVERHPQLVGGVVKVGLALGGLRVAALGAAYAWTAIKSPVLSVMAFIARWRAPGALASLGRFGALGMRVLGVVRMVGAAVAAIGGGPIAAVVGVLTVGALVIRKYWQPIRAWLAGFFDGVRESVGPSFAELGAALAPLKPAWDAVSAAVGRAWDWITRLLAPVNMTSAQLAAAGDSGRRFGRLFAGMLQFAIGNAILLARTVGKIGAAIGQVAAFLINSTTASWNQAKAIIGAAVDWIARRVRPILGVAATVGALTGTAANALGLVPGPSARPTQAVPSLARLPGRAPPVAPPAPARAASNAAVQQSNVFHITQQPGESGDDLARRIAEKTKQQDGIARRGRLTDGVD